MATIRYGPSGAIRTIAAVPNARMYVQQAPVFAQPAAHKAFDGADAQPQAQPGPIGIVVARVRICAAWQEAPMTRDELTRKILGIKRSKGLTWKTIVAEIGGGSAVYLTAALMGQMRLRPDQAERAAKLFGLDGEEQSLLQDIPYRGSLPNAVPSDPLIYRFYELVQVYGTTWKELIQEEFGDGIMSAIDFDMAIERQPDQKGDRVKLTLSGKFLPYKEY
ncbi:MAG TPA: cyanase [Stellaceae bacterium]|nr:cyanase [Stellaceae bacterium]